MEVDAIVFDIDGVLVDTSESYHRAIVETIEVVYGETIDRADTQLFKDAGGFNNDWRLTEAAALFVLAVEHGYSSDIAGFTDAIAARGGSLEAAQEVIEEALTADALASVYDAWDPDRLRRTFQWLYLGPEYYTRLEDDPPPAERPSPAGFMDDEPILIQDVTIEWALRTGSVGVLTGRPAGEAAIALERVGLDPPREHVITMDDWTGGKPDPSGLQTIARRCDARAILYVGDELDDIRTARNADAADPDRRYYGVGVLTGGLRGEEGASRLHEVGAEAVLDNVNQVPRLVETDTAESEQS